MTKKIDPDRQKQRFSVGEERTMSIDIDEELASADWIKAGKPLDTVAAIQERAAQDKRDRHKESSDRIKAKNAAKTKEQ